MIGLFLRRVFVAGRRKNIAWSTTRRRLRRKASLSTLQWLVLSFAIAAVVGAIFILALYYQPGR
jgi:hypothetical protein